MTNDKGQKTYNLSRKAASSLLKVSTRTLDRYIADKKLSTRVVDTRIWLDEGEVKAFKRSKDLGVRGEVVKVSTDNMSSSQSARQVDSESVLRQDTDHSSTKMNYQKLYSDLKEELREKQERLEIANYRVGQLENQVRNSIPLLEYHRENFQKQKKEEDLKNKLDESHTVIEKLSSKLKNLQLTKKLYFAILLILLALQPLWLLLINLDNFFSN